MTDQPTKAQPTTSLDQRFSDPEAGPTAWDDAVDCLRAAEIYWLTTLRADGSPHTTPLMGVFLDGSMFFCTGPTEQKARNLRTDRRCQLMTGTDRWDDGLDVVIEGRAERVTDEVRLQALADLWESKFGEPWHFDVAGDHFVSDGGAQVADVYEVVAEVARGFGKSPHSQTTWRFHTSPPSDA